MIVLEKSFASDLLELAFGGIFSNPLFQTLAAEQLGILQSVIPPINLDVRPNEKFRDIILQEYALSAAIVLRNRFQTYVKSTSARKDDMVYYSNQVMGCLGLDFKTGIYAVLSQALTAIDFIRIFLSEIFFTVVAVLVILAAILITSLLVADAEEKTFEYGILRTLGMKQPYLVLLLMFQSLLFSVPGVLLGLLVCYLTFVPIGLFLSMFSGSPLDISIDITALLLGILLGLILPIVVGKRIGQLS